MSAQKDIIKNENKPFAKRLSILMKKRNVTQEDLAKEIREKSGEPFDRQTVSRYIHGSSAPDMEKFMIIADFFKASYDYLLGKSDTPQRDFIDITARTGLLDKAIDSLSAMKNISEEELDEKDQHYKLNLKIKKDYKKYIKLINHLLSRDYFISYATTVIEYIENSKQWVEIINEIKNVEKGTGRKAKIGDIDLNMFHDTSVIDFDYNENPTGDDVVDELMLNFKCDDFLDKIKYQEWLMIEKLKKLSLSFADSLMKEIDD